MDFRLSADQLAVRDGVRAFCDGRLSKDRLPELEGTLDRELWRELASLGVFGLRQPERDGGLGLGMVEAVVVFAELGRRLAPGPTTWTHLAAGLVEGAAEGEVVVGGLDCTRALGGPHLVESFESLDVLLVLREEGIEQIPAAELDAEADPGSFDALTPVSVVRALPQPARGIVDAGVVAGLAWGILATIAMLLRSAQGHPCDADPELADSSSAR